jgi:hypothetical protein
MAKKTAVATSGLEDARPLPGGRTGLIRNPLSRRNRKAGPRADLADGEIVLAEPDSLDGLVDALAGFARREVGLVIIDGGDGTVREVLTALPAAYGQALPRLAVLSSGTTNLIAADVGAGRSDPGTIQMLAALAARPQASMIQRRSSLQVAWPDGARPPVQGMFMGAAAFARATDISVRLVRQGRIDEGAGVVATLMSALAQTFAGPERERWMKGDPIRVSADGAEGAAGARFVFLASTLDKLVLGLWPFWGAEDGASGRVRYLDVTAPPKRLVAALPSVMRGRPRPWMDAAGYRSGAAQVIELELDAPFVIDGEVFEAGPSGRVVISAGPEFEFIVP